MRIPRLVTVAGALLALTGSGLAPAGAAVTSGSASHSTAHRPAPPLPRLHSDSPIPAAPAAGRNARGQVRPDETVKNTEFTGNWSGYSAFSPGGGLTSVSANWNVPQVWCTVHGAESSWVGLDGDTIAARADTAIEQTGTTSDCTSGNPSYYAWWEPFPSAAHNYGDPVQPNDAMSASVTNLGNGTYRSVLTDNTRGWSESTTFGSTGTGNTAEAIVESPASTGWSRSRTSGTPASPR